jgi:hypothetical protein
MMANLEEAHLKGVHKLTIEQLSKAKTLSNANYTKSFLIHSERTYLFIYKIKPSPFQRPLIVIYKGKNIK